MNMFRINESVMVYLFSYKKNKYVFWGEYPMSEYNRLHSLELKRKDMLLELKRSYY